MRARSKSTKRNSYFSQFIPEIFIALREGYSWKMLGKDASAGLTVAIVSFSLSMALAIASGTTPEKGLITAIVGGILIAVLGGSRFQIGGPAGAFVIITAGIISNFGYDGMLASMLMGGIILIIAGLSGFGSVLKFVPQPVVMGFSTGIGILLFSTQVKEILGLHVKTPDDFIDKWHVLISNAQNFDPTTLSVALASLALIVILRFVAPKAPGYLLVAIFGAVAVALLDLNIDTIGSRFGDLPRTLPSPELPNITWHNFTKLIPSACTVAFLAGVESLLSASVGDNMTGRRHRPNPELIAQGVANAASAIFTGIPATGLVARTAMNIRAGAVTPIAAVLKATFIVLIMFFCAPVVKYIPLASLSAILVMVAWNMSELDRFRDILRIPRGDALVWGGTIILTTVVDLTVAIGVGIVLGSMLFVNRMTRVVDIDAEPHLFEDDDKRTIKEELRRGAEPLPHGVEAFHFHGPFFFGVTSRLGEVNEEVDEQPMVYIMDMTDVPLIDSSGIAELSEFVRRCLRGGAVVIFCGLKGQPRLITRRMRLAPRGDFVRITHDYEGALQLALQIISKRPAKSK